MRYDLTAKDEQLRRAILPEPTHIKQKHGELSPSSPFYLLGGTLFAALALFGLFAGFLLSSPIGTFIAGGEPILHGSLFGVAVEVVRGSIPLPVPAIGAGLEGVLPLFLYLMSILLAFTTLLTLALAAVAFIKNKYARTVCFFNGILLVIVYGGLLFGGLLYGRVKGTFSFDASVGIVFFAAAALLTLCALVRRGAKGLFNALLLLCSLFSFAAVCFSPLFQKFDSLFRGAPDGQGILLLVLSGVQLLNLVLSALRLGKKGNAHLDLLRFSVQALLAGALMAICLTVSGSPLDFFTPPYAALFLLLPPMAGVIFSVLAGVLAPHKAPKKEEPNKQEEPKKEADSVAADPAISASL